MNQTIARMIAIPLLSVIVLFSTELNVQSKESAAPKITNFFLTADTNPKTTKPLSYLHLFTDESITVHIFGIDDKGKPVTLSEDSVIQWSGGDALEIKSTGSYSATVKLVKPLKASVAQLSAHLLYDETSFGIFIQVAQKVKKLPKEVGDNNPAIVILTDKEGKSTKITQRDLNEKLWAIRGMGTPEKPEGFTKEDEERQLQYLIEQTILIQEAEKEKITVSDDQIREALRELMSRRRGKETLSDGELNEAINDLQLSVKNYFLKNARNYLLIKNLENTVLAKRSGAAIIVRFDKAYEVLTVYAKGSAEVLTRDREYAEKLIKDLHQKVKNNQIPIEQAIEISNSDDQLGIPAWGKGADRSFTFSRKFDFKDSLKRTIINRDPKFWEDVFKLKEGELSEPTLYGTQKNKLVRTPEGGWEEDGKQIIKIDVLWAFVKVTKAEGKYPLTWEEYQEKVKQDYEGPW